MNVLLNLQPLSWDHKPTHEEVARFIKKDISNHTQELTPEALMMAIEKGQTFTAGVLAGSTADTWQMQQILCADIDNGKHRKDEDGNRVFVPVSDPMSPDEAIEVMAAYNIVPCFMYYSFSNDTEGKANGIDKFRIVVILDKPVTDPAAMKGYSEQFASIFNDKKAGVADNGVHNLDRLYFGSVPGSVFFKTGTITPLDSLSNLPKPEPIPETPTTARRETVSYSGAFDLLECLDYIDPEEREVWFKVGMALKHEGYSFEDWDLWASRCTDKHNRTDSIRVWKSLSANGSNGSITGAYITKLAKQNGYIPPSKRPRPAPVFLDWDSPIH